MKIVVVGTGYVGLVSGTCFSEMGVDVTCVDIDEQKIKTLCNGEVPIYEPGLTELIQRNVAAGRLHFTTQLSQCLAEAELVFIAVGTPEDKDGAADLSYVLEVAREFGRHITHSAILVVKSTVPVGTTYRVQQTAQEELARRGVEIPFEVASNPEFLKEGSAVKDFMSPDRVVVGVESEEAKRVLTQLYRPFLINNFRVIFMDIPSAEMTKYASNAMLATRISFMNDIANLCEKVGADVNMVRKGVGADARIGSKFLYPGCGYGGSCFPKDVKALIHTAHEHGCKMRVLEAVDAVNEQQKELLFHKLMMHYGVNLQGKTVAIWGLSYKPETDDMREAPSLVLIGKLLDAGCRVQVYDPVAMPECRRRLGDKVVYGRDMYEAAVDADALLLVTEWKAFRLPSWPTLKRIMRSPVIFDGRNIYEAEEIESLDFEYYKIG
ncbi:MAG: UDP-glucose/GDP-mannose dehydrogenase family protein [Alistipes sp.]|nr:UDP-glucose/GDP-mannose dehydrogenase family protein [Alistipes sp.]MBR4070466.1 UDP-glucose/GDP-mannose dehydrogenase family protein [Bacteroidaceae bacterium]